MSDLKLESLRIRNFRAFKDLKIDRLGRVNLIVGDNNVGKTALLEALWIYAHRGDFSSIWNVLKERDETYRHTPDSLSFEASRQIDAIRHLFSGFKRATDISDIIEVGPVGADRSGVSIAFEFKTEVDPDLMQEEAIPVLKTQYGRKKEVVYRLDREPKDRIAQRDNDRQVIPSMFVRAEGVSSRRLPALWDEAVMAGAKREEMIVRALQIIAGPEVTSIRFVSSESDFFESRIPVVAEAFEQRVPLRSLGGGMNRMLGLALAMSNSADGFLLIDEIENGLHYSNQADMWRLVFNMAEELNVQVFATTHSFDCIQAFQEAANEHREEGILYSLRWSEREKNKVVAVSYEEGELKSVARSHIEVR